MKSRNIILSLSSIILGILFLAGSTGITLIIHNCPVCDKHSITAGIYLSPSEPEDHCCEAADMHTSPDKGTSLEGSCCHFKIDKLKLNNYSPVIPLTISFPGEIPCVIDLSDNNPVPGQIILAHEHHNKHGGRFLITYHHQYIS